MTCGTLRFKKSQIIPNSTNTAQIREILRSNSSPPAALEASLRDVISKAPEELERYDTDIEKLQSLLSSIVFQRAALPAHFEACRSILSPIRRLPIELLAEIFKTCSYPEKDNNLVGTDIPALELIASLNVCSFWHNVAMGTPRLWSRILVDTKSWH
ncbi:hypothetical protein B0H19DRAFT_932929, partial [Mycena capillaripes]